MAQCPSSQRMFTVQKSQPWNLKIQHCGHKLHHRILSWTISIHRHYQQGRRLESYNTAQVNILWHCFIFVFYMVDFLIFIYVVCLLLASVFLSSYFVELIIFLKSPCFDFNIIFTELGLEFSLISCFHFMDYNLNISSVIGTSFSTLL
jgi:hypothetical protein